MECYTSITLVIMLMLTWPILHFFIIPKLVLLLLHFFKKRISSYKLNKSIMPPGPHPYPIIGNILTLIGQKPPHQALYDLSTKFGPLMTLKLGSLSTIVISSPQIAKEALTKHDLAFSSREVPDIARVLDHHNVSMVWSPADDLWRTLRKLCATNIFSPQKLDSTKILRSKKVQELVQFVGTCCDKSEPIDIGHVAFTTILNSLSNTLFSIDFGKYNGCDENIFNQNFKGIVENIMDDAGRTNVADIFPILRFIDPQGLRRRGEDHTLRLLKVLSDIFDERMRLRCSQVLDRGEVTSGDVLDSLLNLMEENSTELSRHHLLHLLLDLFVAGVETTTSTVEWAMAELLHNPPKMARAKQELSQVLGKHNQPEESNTDKFPYLEAIVEETFRLHPPVPFLHHKSKSEAEILGFKVPKNTQVLVNVWAIGRNPGTWSNPHDFVPERFLGSKINVKGFDFELIPFGAGRRMCPALPLAHRTVHFVLASLLHCFDWEIEGGKKAEELDMSEKFGLTIRRAQPLKLIPSHTY